jgi:hypothetical protein
MLKRIWHLAAVLGTGAVLAFGAITLAQAGGSTHRSPAESSKESTAPENSARDPDNVQYTAPGDPDYHGAKTAAQVQRQRSGQGRHHASRTRRASRSRHSGSGHSARSSNDPGGPAETTGEQETSVESEQGQPGEPANGHQDPPGQDVNHECTGNCVE